MKATRKMLARRAAVEHRKQELALQETDFGAWLGANHLHSYRAYFRATRNGRRETFIAQQLVTDEFLADALAPREMILETLYTAARRAAAEHGAIDLRFDKLVEFWPRDITGRLVPTLGVFA
jgi:hypothetical protein